VAEASCPLRGQLDARPRRAAIKDRALHAAIPLARARVRYGPSRASALLWGEKVEPYLAWHSHRFTARTVFGARMRGDTREVLEQHIYFFGVWEPNLTRWLQRRLAPGDTFVDVGANVGYFSLLASRLVGRGGAVAAIEASPTIHRRLVDNLRRNRARNVTAFNRVAADGAGLQSVYLGPESHHGLTTVRAEAGWAHEADVEAGRVPEIVGPETWGAARIVKIDVEGAENAVVRGMLADLDAARPDLEVVVELHPGADRELFDWFAQGGFHPYALEVDYSPEHYRLRPAPAPRRIEGAVAGELDVIFSRTDAAQL